MQECLTHWFFKRDQFDVTKPATCKTYMTKVISNKLKDILDLQGRQKRRALNKSVPLEDFFFDGEEDSCLAVEDKNFESVLKSDTEAILLSAVEKLSRKQKEVCRLLKDEGLSLNQIGNRLSIPYATLYAEVVRIREVFKKEGLKDYL